GIRHQRLEWHGGYHALGIQYGTGPANNFSTSIDDPTRFINSTARFLLTEQVLFQPNDKFALMPIFILNEQKTVIRNMVGTNGLRSALVRKFSLPSTFPLRLKEASIIHTAAPDNTMAG